MSVLLFSYQPQESILSLKSEVPENEKDGKELTYKRYFQKLQNKAVLLEHMGSYNGKVLLLIKEISKIHVTIVDCESTECGQGKWGRR